ncbi:MAG: hypothetical protein EAZ57_03780 [Cytophagales bacterium]|nr:MAG: hypothetical protein EAZ67_04795 [Cytophagales bacterium]TAF61331.1 MAG: hypothetical protein EAZ57_03780 [Cytophagales bacterium]
MKLFVIGIGGTGMRCLESLVQLCAIGMAGNSEINVLSLDTDTNNGNKNRSESLLETYIRVKKDRNGQQVSLDESFFSAKLNFYRFAPSYSKGHKNFNQVCGIGQAMNKDINHLNEALAELLFDKDTRSFDLEHGYRAQTHIGSYLMYNAIRDEIRRIHKGAQAQQPHDVLSFLNKLRDAAQESDEEVRVFMMGSVFGGTGASSIPILPKSLEDALTEIDPSAKFSGRIVYGATLLTNYFGFNKPKDDQIKQEKIIADADKFAFNCQAALTFYDGDTTIKNTYSRLYMVGWPLALAQYNSQNNTTITGGLEQRNPAHVAELLCASAAIDFLLDNPAKLGKHEFVFRNVENSQDQANFTFSDFFGTPARRIEFTNNLSSFLAFCFMLQNEQEGSLGTFAKILAKEHGIADYKDIPEEDIRAIDDFTKHFAFSYRNGLSAIDSGWLRQMRESLNTNLLFDANVYQTDPKVLKKFNWGAILTNKEHHFAEKGIFSSPKPYEEFLSKFKKDPEVRTKPDFKSAKQLERLLNHVYKTLTKLHKIKV